MLKKCPILYKKYRYLIQKCEQQSHYWIICFILLHREKEKAQINDIIITWVHAIILDTAVDSKRIAVIKDKNLFEWTIWYFYTTSWEHCRSSLILLFVINMLLQLCYIVFDIVCIRNTNQSNVSDTKFQSWNGFSIISPTQGTLHGPFGDRLTGQAKSKEER